MLNEYSFEFGYEDGSQLSESARLHHHLHTVLQWLNYCAFEKIYMQIININSGGIVILMRSR